MVYARGFSHTHSSDKTHHPYYLIGMPFAQNEPRCSCFQLNQLYSHVVWETSFSPEGECLFYLEASSSIQKFQSPGYPDKYPSKTRCQWQIRAPEDKSILLTFPFFYVQDSCSSDYVFIFDTLSTDASHAITQWVDALHNEVSIFFVEYRPRKLVVA